MSLPRGAILPQARVARGAGLWPALVMLICLPINAATPLKDQPHLRRPVAAAWIEPGKLLAVANSRSGSISIVDIPGRKVLDEFRVGEKLADIAAMPAGGRLLAVDEKRHELIVLDRDGNSLRVSERIPVSQYPVDIEIAPSGTRVHVASLWSRKVTVLRAERATGSKPAFLKTLATIDIPFNPRHQALVMDHLRRYLFVADAFGGNLAVLDTNKFKLIARHEIEGHGIELATDSSLRHHVLHGNRPTNARSIERGFLIHPATTTLTKGQLLDTNGLHFPSSRAWDLHFEQHWAKTGPRLSSFQEHVLDRFADCVVLGSTTISLGDSPEPTPADRGEALFYDTRLSAGQVPDAELFRPTRVGPHRKGGWMSCHSCHTDGHTCGLMADTPGDGTYGTPKRIPTLLGTRLTDKWAWNGDVRELHEQVGRSLKNTMHASHVTPQDVFDVTAFLHTLPPPPPLQPATDEPEDTAQLARGSALFNKLGCAKCHVPPLTYTSSDAYDVGMEDEKGLKKFNPPSLRGVSQGYAFFHDGRAKSLEEVLTVHGHQLERTLEKNELADLLRFLRSL